MPTKKSLSDGFYSFISYSSRDHEAKTVKCFVDDYCKGLRERGVYYIPVYYDGFYMPPTPSRPPYPNSWLEDKLISAIKKSDFTTCFLSPGYIGSKWCGLEYMVSEELFNTTPNTSRPLRHNILPICWKSFPCNATLLAEKVSRRVWINVSNDLKDHWDRAIIDAVDGTIEFLKAQYPSKM